MSWSHVPENGVRDRMANSDGTTINQEESKALKLVRNRQAYV